MTELSDDKARLDVARIHAWLASCYLSPGIARALVERAIAGSFRSPMRPEQYMERLSSDFADLLWAQP